MIILELVEEGPTAVAIQFLVGLRLRLNSAGLVPRQIHTVREIPIP